MKCLFENMVNVHFEINQSILMCYATLVVHEQLANTKLCFSKNRLVTWKDLVRYQSVFTYNMCIIHV